MILTTPVFQEVFGNEATPEKILGAEDIHLHLTPDTGGWSEDRCRDLCKARGSGEPPLDDRRTRVTIADWREWAAFSLGTEERRPFDWYSLPGGVATAVALLGIGEAVSYSPASRTWWWRTKVTDPGTLKTVLHHAAVWFGEDLHPDP